MYLYVYIFICILRIHLYVYVDGYVEINVRNTNINKLSNRAVNSVIITYGKFTLSTCISNIP